jgi:hypothetical protein
MDQSELNCATIGLANRPVITGRQTRENVGSRNGPRLRITACFTLLGCLVMAGLLLAQDQSPRAQTICKNWIAETGVKAETYALK